MKIARTVVWVLVGTAAGCSFVLDKDKTQCTIDDDCVHFKGHPFCQEGVCVVSNLGPEDCTPERPPGMMKTQSDYLNACSTSKCVPFDNCMKLGLCPGAAASLPAAAGQMTDKSTASQIQVAKPTNLCTDGAPGVPGSPNIVWLFGSADFGPLLRAVQPSLSALNPPYRAVFVGTSSCVGATSVFDSDPTKRIMRDPLRVNENLGGWAFYFDENRQQVNCRIDPAGTPEPTPGVSVDVGISNLYGPTCSSSYNPGPPSNIVGEYFGPVVPFVLSVQAVSTQQSISAEAAHLVFGLGGVAPPGSGMKDAMPWTDWRNYFIRNSSSGSTVLTALLVDVPKTAFWGIDRASTENLRDSLLASPAAESSIGILSIDFNDKYRGNLKALYLQAKGQNCGYLPDSSPTTYDKANVRDGHYPLWGYVHLFTRLGAGGEPSAAAKAFVLQFNVPKLEQRLVDDIIAASLTPQCAMKVARTSEVGDFTARTGYQCGCYFDLKTKGRNTCQSCAISEDCPSGTPACNYGFCEKN